MENQPESPGSKRRGRVAEGHAACHLRHHTHKTNQQEPWKHLFFRLELAGVSLATSPSRHKAFHFGPPPPKEKRKEEKDVLMPHTNTIKEGLSTAKKQKDITKWKPSLRTLQDTHTTDSSLTPRLNLYMQTDDIESKRRRRSRRKRRRRGGKQRGYFRVILRQGKHASTLGHEKIQCRTENGTNLTIIKRSKI